MPDTAVAMLEAPAPESAQRQAQRRKYLEFRTRIHDQHAAMIACAMDMETAATVTDGVDVLLPSFAVREACADLQRALQDLDMLMSNRGLRS